MRRIVLDASDWQVPDDFWHSWTKAAGAPDWFGRNLDALLDGLRGGIHPLAPPYELYLTGTANAPRPLAQFLARVADVFADARDEGLAVSLHLM